jgi:dihydrodipicolinate synthase/N-acetylneuraminate lyase
MNDTHAPRKLNLAASCYTPFTTDGSAVNEAALRRQLNRFVEASLDAVWLVSSGTAERNVLTDDEVDRIVDVAVEEVGGRISVCAMGSEPRSATENVAFANRMLDRGVDAVQVGPLEPGHSYMPTEPELRAFYEDTVSGIRGPCFLSSHVSVGYEVAPTVLVEAAREHDNVVGLNVTHFRNFLYAPRILTLAGTDVPVTVGSPINALEPLLLGAAGIMSSFDMNVAPQLYRELGAAWAGGDFSAISTAYLRVSSLFVAILGGGGLSIAKAILDRLGLEGGNPRRPRRPLDDDDRRLADHIIEHFELQP